MHPADELRGSKSDKLGGKRIVLGVSGSIAAVECVKLARELARHGARVIPVMSPAACRILHPDALEFACGQRPITELTGQVEHVSICGEVPDRADLLLIAPATANTVSKMACGIDDTPLTTFATTAIGTGIPVMVVPAMHGSMYRNRAVMDNLERLRELGVIVLDPRLEERKAKMADTSRIVAGIIRLLGKRDLTGKKVLIIAGSTAEPLDDLRVLTNRSSGGTGVALAVEAYERGGDITVWMGRSEVEPPAYIPNEPYCTVADLMARVKQTADFDIVLMPAAVSDYSPERIEGKMPSGRERVDLVLSRNPKVIEAIRESFEGFLVGFKAESGVSDEELRRRASGRFSEVGMDLMVANDVGDVNAQGTRVHIMDALGSVTEAGGPKDSVAAVIWGRIVGLCR